MSKDKPRISVVVPVHNMENKEFFMDRLMASLDKQTFRNFEVVITEEGKMAENTNAGIKKAKGEIIKILFMDDYLYSEHALQHIDNNFRLKNLKGRTGWLVSGCVHDDGGIHNPHYPRWNDMMYLGENTIGSPSVLAFENNKPLLFDETLSWMLDCDLYDRLYKRYGKPKVVNYLDVAIGIGPHQTTHKMSDEEKWREVTYVKGKHETD